MTAWETVTIGSVCSTYSGGTPSTAHPEYYGGDIPWIASADLNRGRISSVKGRITRLGLERSAAKLVRSGMPLIALYGATAGVPARTYIDGAINQAILAMVPCRIDAEYLYQWLRANRDQIIERYTQGGQPNLSGAIVRSIELPLPPAAEQHRIAAALRDADDLITTLERMIAKRQAIKLGMMQQLLAGKARLPGFTGPWEQVTVGDVAVVKTGPFGSSLHERDYVAQGTPIITVEHLGQRGIIGNDAPMVSEADRRRLRAYCLEAGDIVFSRVGSIDRNAMVTDRESGWLFSGRLLRVRFNRLRADPAFMSAQFHSKRFVEAVRSVAVGQTMPSLNTSILKGIPIALPPLKEQKAIGAVAVSVNDELERLEGRLVKARAIKQGMMQQLLTGRTRLPVQEGVV